MRVLIFQGYVDPEGRGGEELLEAWPTLPGVAGGVARAGADVDVVVAARRDERLVVGGVSYRFVAERRLPSPRRLLGYRAAPHPARSLRATVTARPDVVHLHGLSFPLQARALRRTHPSVPLLAQDHADAPPSGWRRPLHRWGYAGLDAVAFTAPEQAAPFVRAGVLREDLPVFGIIEGSSDFTPGPRERARQARGVSGNPAVAWVGNLTPGKDPLGALEAFRLALPDLRDPALWMVFRGGSLEAEVRRRVQAEESLRHRVRLVGPLPHEDMEGFLRAADVLLAPSRREGSGYAVIEALACGTPVAASDVPPHRAILGAGGAGVMAPPGEPAALARALASVAADAERRRGVARRRFEEALSFDAIGRELLRAYRALAERRSVVARARAAEASA